MITKEQFITLIKEVQSLDSELDKWSELGLNVFESNLGNAASNIAFMAYKYLFKDKGVDTINWWLYERDQSWEDDINNIYDKDGNIIPSETVEDLWNLVKDDRL